MNQRDRTETHGGRTPDPPARLRRRVLRTLRARGLLTPGPAAGWRPAAAAAAGLFLLAAGYAVGSATGGPPAPPDEPRFILLLYEDSAYVPPDSVRDVVSAYRAWAAPLRDAGIFVGGEKLHDAGRVLVPPAEAVAREIPPASPLGTLSGYFVIAADREEDALAIARTCPHLLFGGSIVVRRIDPT